MVCQQKQDLHTFQHWMEQAGVTNWVIWALNYRAQHKCNDYRQTNAFVMPL